MNSIMRRTVRGAATGLGALALIAGASACGALGDLAGGGDEGDDPSAEQPAEDEGSESEDGGSEGADEDSEGDDAVGSDGEDTEAEGSEGAEGDDAAGGDADAEPLSEEDLTAAQDQALAFMKAAAGGDAEGACALALNPSTGEPLSGAALDGCVTGYEEEMEEADIELDPALADMIDSSMIEVTDNGDGTAYAILTGSTTGVDMIKAEDGTWYVDSAGLL